MEMLSLSLLQNGLSFFEESLRKAVDAENRDDSVLWKFAIINLANAFELFIKEMLERRDPGSILLNTRRGEVKTIGVRHALDHLIRMDPRSFLDDEKRDFEELLSLRNEIVHFKFAVSPLKLKLLFISQFVLLKSLVDHHLKIQIEELIDQAIWDQVLEMESYFEALERGAQKKMRLHDLIHTDVANCKACNGEGLVFANFERTSHCGDGYVVHKCFRCGHEFDDLQECESCGQLLHNDELVTIDTELDGEIVPMAVCHNCETERSNWNFKSEI